MCVVDPAMPSPAISAERAFLYGSSHSLGRRREEKRGAAGSSLDDLVGGIFPSSYQHTETPGQLLLF